MADTRTYEDFAGTLGRRVARVKEACGGAVARHQPGGKAGFGFFSRSVPLLNFSKRKREAAEAAALEEERRKWSEMLERTLAHRDEIIENLGADNVRGFDAENHDYFGQEYIDAIEGHDVPFDPDYGSYYDILASDLVSGPVDERRGRKALGDIDGELAERKKGILDSMRANRGRRGHAQMRDGGNIGKVMNYTVYFKDGGLLPRSQRRVYQTGGKASAKDIFNALQQGAQILLSGQGSKQQQQQAQQIYMQVIEAYQNGDPQAKDILNTVFSGVEQGKKEFAPIAQVFQSIMQQMQKREFGGRLDYITMLRNGGRPRYRTGGVSRSYQPGDEMEYEGEERTPGFFGRLGSRYKERQQRVAQMHQNLGENAQAFGNKIDDKLNEIGDMTLRDVGNGIVNGVKKGWELYTYPAHKTAEAIKSLGKGKQQASRTPYFIEREQY